MRMVPEPLCRRADGLGNPSSTETNNPVHITAAPFSDNLPKPQGSSGTTQSRPFPARAVKVMESAGQYENEHRRNAPVEVSRIKPEAGIPSGLFSGVKMSNLAQWAERDRCQSASSCVSKVPDEDAVTLRYRQSGVSPAPQNIFSPGARVSSLRAHSFCLAFQDGRNTAPGGYLHVREVGE